MLGGFISIQHNLKGPNISAVTACAAGTHGIIEATKITDVNVPVIVRLDGTNAPEAAEILKNANKGWCQR